MATANSTSRKATSSRRRTATAAPVTELGPLLLRIRFETGCSMLLIEHDMPLIRSVSDELVALDLGRVVTRGLPDAVVEHPDVVASYLGTSADVINRSGGRS